MLFFGLSLWAKTGRSPNRNVAQGNNTLGVSELSNLRSERAAGGSSLAILSIPFALSERKIAIPFLPRVLPWAVFPLGFQPVFAVTMVAAKSSVLYSCWSFAPCFHLTTVSTQSSDLYYFWVLSPTFLVTLVAAKSSVLYSCWGFAPCFHVTMVSPQSSALYSFWAFSLSSLVTMVAAKSSVLYSC